MHKYVTSFKSFDIGTDENKLKSGDIIIATNLAGRGTDLIIDQ